MTKREGPSRNGFKKQALAHFSWGVEEQGKAPWSALAPKPAPKPVESPPTVRFESGAFDYVRAGMAVDHEEATCLRAMLRDQATEVAKRDGIDVGKAYKRIVDGYRAMPGMEDGDVMFRILSVLARQERKVRDPEETMSFVTFLGDALRDALEAEPSLAVRKNLFLRRFYCAFDLIWSHRACDPRPDVADRFIPSALLANALTLWAEVNCLVPPCRYLRLERLLRDRGIQPDAAHAVLRKHGADPLDDLADLVARGTLDESGLWAMAVADELPHDPSFARLPKPPAFSGNRFAAALEYAFPGWKALDRSETLRGGLFDETHAYRPGWYRPAVEEPPRPEPPPAEVPPALPSTAVAVAPIPAAPRPNQRTERLAGSLARIQGLTLETAAESGTIAPRRDGPITAAMNGICAQCANVAAVGWNVVRSVLTDVLAEREIDVLETAMARMVLHESRARPTKHGHIVYFERVLKGLLLDPQENMSAIMILNLSEKAGIRFSALEEFHAFHDGISRRIGPRRGDGTSEEAYEGRLESLFLRLAEHVPHIHDPAERAALGTADVFLLGLDLYADAKGAVPPCKCLRVAVRSRRIGRDDAIYLLRQFGPDRTDDLIEMLGTNDLPPAALEILPLHPEEAARRDLTSLTSLLREWVRAGKPSGFTRFAAGFAA